MGEELLLDLGVLSTDEVEKAKEPKVVVVVGALTRHEQADKIAEGES